MSTRDRLAEIKVRADNATPGPWSEPYHETAPGDEGWWIHNGRQGSHEYAVAVTFVLNPRDEADAQFIAHSREDIGWLIAEVERLRGAP